MHIACLPSPPLRALRQAQDRPRRGNPFPRSLSPSPCPWQAGTGRPASGHGGALRRAQESGGDRTGQWRIVCISPSLAQGLEGAGTADLSEIEITPMGTGLHWPRLDANLTVDGLLAGIFGSRSWMRAHAARAGRARTPAKAAAARANGAKGGRPRKTAVVPA